MQIISEASLEDFPRRIQYLRDFINFTVEDENALHAAKPVVGPLVPAVVDAVYDKLLSFSVTAKAFVPRQTGYAGAVPTKMADLSQEHPQIKFRKDFLARYLVKLVTMDYSQLESWQYLDKVGLMHTGNVGFAHRFVRCLLSGLRIRIKAIVSQGEEATSPRGIHPLFDSSRLRRGHPRQRCIVAPRFGHRNEDCSAEGS